MRNIIRVLFSLSLFVFVSCNGPKYLVNQGKKYEKERDYENAVIKYAEAYSKDPKNKDAIKGMKKAGGRLLKDKLEGFYDAYNEKNYTGAIIEYKDAEKLITNLERRSVVLTIPDSTRNHYKDAISKHTRTLYLEGAKNIDSGNYEKAREIINEIEKFDKEFEQLSTLKLALEADPFYKRGMEAYKKGDKGNAIVQLLKVQEIYPDYRETTKIINELKSGSTVKLAYLPLENLTQEIALGRELSSMIEVELFRMQNPLLQIYNPSSIGYAPLNNGQFQDDKSIIALGNSAGVDFVVLPSVVGFKVENSTPNEVFNVGYIKERILYFDPYFGQTTNYQYREIKYKEITEETKVTIQLKYRIISVKSGTTIMTDMLSKSVINIVKYADYNGPLEDLYPTTGYINQNELRKWRARFTAKSDKKPLSELTKITQEELAKQFSGDIVKIVFQY